MIDVADWEMLDGYGYETYSAKKLTRGLSQRGTLVVIVSSLVYRRYFKAGRQERKLWSVIRRILLWLGRDPMCLLPIHGQMLKVPLAHCLPLYLSDYPFYDRLPQRLSRFLRRALNKNDLILIDVGANIGDSIAAFREKESDRFLAIEADPLYYAILLSNWGACQNVTCVNCLCSSMAADEAYELERGRGTTRFVHSSGGTVVETRTLDEILDEHLFAREADILKVDTDGHDFEVLAGAWGFIRRCHPAIMFECAPFGNPNYVNNVMNLLNLFQRVGYSHCLVYSNVGYLFGKFALDALSPIKQLLGYQIMTDSLYYDIVLLNDYLLGEFHAGEVEFFVHQIKDPELQKCGIAAGLT